MMVGNIVLRSINWQSFSTDSIAASSRKSTSGGWYQVYIYYPSITYR